MGFQTVQRRRKKGPVFGAKVNNGNSIAGTPTPRTIDIFIGGIDPKVSTDSLSKYLQNAVSCHPVDIKSNRVNTFNQSFLVTINATDKNKIFNPESWEKNIIVKPFRHPRTSDNYIDSHLTNTERRHSSPKTWSESDSNRHHFESSDKINHY